MEPFIPQHSQPVSIASLVELELDTLTAEISRLQNSIGHLHRSNFELLEYCNRPLSSVDDYSLDEATRREFALSVRDNEETIARQEERLVMIRLAMERKVGVGATNTHYDVGSRLHSGQQAMAVAPALTPGRLGSEAAGDAPMPDDGAEGIYL